MATFADGRRVGDSVMATAARREVGRAAVGGAGRWLRCSAGQSSLRMRRTRGRGRGGGPHRDTPTRGQRAWGRRRGHWLGGHCCDGHWCGGHWCGGH